MKQRKQPSGDVQERARQALAWIETPAGRKSANEADRRVAETSELLQRGYDISPAKLHDPFTV